MKVGIGLVDIKPRTCDMDCTQSDTSTTDANFPPMKCVAPT